jgi:hypothetical protein
VGYAVLFFLIIVLPYFILFNEKSHISILQKLDNDILAIKNLQDGINLNFSSFLNQTNNYNFELNQSQIKQQSYEDIKDLLLRSRSLSSGSGGVITDLILKMTKYPKCTKVINITTWIDCNEQSYSLKVINDTDKVLKVRTNTIAGLNNTIDKAVKRMRNITEDLVKDEQQSSDDFIKKNVNSTKIFLNGITSRLEQLRTDSIKKLDPNALSGLPETFQKLSEISGQLSSFDRNLTMERTTINQKRQNIESTLKEIQAPFLGKVPIGLDDAILAFPITLSIGIIIFTSLVNKVIDAGKKVEDAAKNSISLVLYPEKWSRDNRLRFFIIFIPVIIFGATLLIISNIWLDRMSDLLHSEYQIVYIVLYLASISIVCITYGRTLRSILRSVHKRIFYTSDGRRVLRVY